MKKVFLFLIVMCIGTSYEAIAGNGGFNVLLAGHMFQGSANSYGSYSVLWTSSGSDSNDVYHWGRELAYFREGVFRGAHVSSWMFSVRCKKDE